MTEQEAVEVIYEGLAGERSIPIKLSLGEGLDKDMLSQVEAAIRFLIERWRDRPEVPKRLAAAFLDLQTAMQWGGNLYSEKEQEEIEDASIELIQMAWELFEQEPGR